MAGIAVCKKKNGTWLSVTQILAEREGCGGGGEGQLTNGMGLLAGIVEQLPVVLVYVQVCILVCTLVCTCVWNWV